MIALPFILTLKEGFFIGGAAFIACAIADVHHACYLLWNRLRGLGDRTLSHPDEPNNQNLTSCSFDSVDLLEDLEDQQQSPLEPREYCVDDQDDYSTESEYELEVSSGPNDDTFFRTSDSIELQKELADNITNKEQEQSHKSVEIDSFTKDSAHYEDCNFPSKTSENVRSKAIVRISNCLPMAFESVWIILGLLHTLLCLVCPKSTKSVFDLTHRFIFKQDPQYDPSGNV